MNEEKVIIEYQDKLQKKEVKKFKEATSNYYVLCYIDELEKENKILKENNQSMQEEMARTWAKLQEKEDIINKANKYVINHLKQDMLSDFTGANYIQEYIEEPDGLLEILDNKGE